MDIYTRTNIYLHFDGVIICFKICMLVAEREKSSTYFNHKLACDVYIYIYIYENLG